MDNFRGVRGASSTGEDVPASGEHQEHSKRDEEHHLERSPGARPGACVDESDEGAADKAITTGSYLFTAGR